MASGVPLPERSPSMIEKMKFRRRSDTQSLKKSKEQPQANTSANMDSTLYSTGDWSDVTVTCKNHTWRLHREILISKCDYFRDRCLAEQSNTQLSQPITIAIEDEDPQVIEALLRYVYTSDLDWNNSDHELHPYHFYALVFKMAIKFKIPRLALLALEPIELSEVSRVDEELQDAVPELYAMPLDREGRELRETLIKKTAKPWGVGMLNFPSYKGLVATVPEFALDTIAYLARESQGDTALPMQSRLDHVGGG